LRSFVAPPKSQAPRGEWRLEVARKLRERPDLVRQLHVHQTQIDRIPLLGIDIVPVDQPVMVRSAELRRRYGLLTSDSIVAACLDTLSIRTLASADTDFALLEAVDLHVPRDLGHSDDG
jgi:predicted nucleic acid-binding protein